MAKKSKKRLKKMKKKPQSQTNKKVCHSKKVNLNVLSNLLQKCKKQFYNICIFATLRELTKEVIFDQLKEPFWQLLTFLWYNIF